MCVAMIGISVYAGLARTSLTYATVPRCVPDYLKIYTYTTNCSIFCYCFLVSFSPVVDETSSVLNRNYTYVGRK